MIDAAKIQAALADRKTALQRKAELGSGIDLEPLIRSQPLLDDLTLTGYEDDNTRRLLIASHLLGKTGRLTLRPVLPLLLQLKGKPYHLQDHFPFEPFFRSRMPKRTLLKTGRQVSKSTSLAAQGVLFSNCIPYFSTLYVTPLFEMIRRFSQNYVRPFIETSPVMKLFSGHSTINSVLQRSFKNRSQMIFSFAFLDAERTRGIAADKNCLAEGTLVELSGGRSLPIELVEPGTRLVSADKNGMIIEDTVTEKIYQGVQDVFEVTFSGGSVVRCTADERFRCGDGRWVYLRDLFAGPPEAERSTVELVPEADTLGLLVRGRGNRSLQPDVLVASGLPARPSPGGVLLAQGRAASGLRHDSARRREEPRLGQNNRVLRNGLQFGVRSAGGDHDARRQEDRHGSLGRRVDLGVPGVLGHGRRDAAGESDLLLHTRIFQDGGRTACTAAPRDGDVFGNGGPGQGSWASQAYHPAEHGRFTTVVATGRAVGSSELAVQAHPGASAGDLLDLRAEVPRTQGPSQGTRPGLQTAGVLADSSSETLEAEPYGVAASGQESAGTATIVRVAYLGRLPVWDLNMAAEHAFFANGVLVHNCIDEVQDMDISFLPIIHETMSGSVDWGIVQYAGTPKTLDNTIETLWLDSSMAEWFIKCPHGGCGAWNIPSLEFHLLDMMGPWHADISEKNPGVVCHKCRKPINPRTGRWVHRYRDRRWTFAGYHVPQIIMPMHYANQEKWSVLMGKREGKGNTPLHVFFNEVCGESFDAGAKMVTITDLKRAATLPWHNKLEEAKPHVHEYMYRVCSVDWGGGGVDAKKRVDEKYRSYTTAAVCGMLPDGKIHVIYGYRSNYPHSHVREARIVLGIMANFRCSHLVHDFTGAGTVRETVIKQAGMPYDRIIPVAFYPAHRTGIFQLKEPTKMQPRWHYACDKPRSLNYLAQMIKSGIIRFFAYDHYSAEDPGLLHDFLHLIEDKSDSSGLDVYKILHDPAGPDDFAMAVDAGVMALCTMSGNWPDVADAEGVLISEEVLKAAFPVQVHDWDDV